MKKLISLALALIMILSLATTAFAAETAHTITITNEKAGHTYEAYQIFAGNPSNEDNKLINITWGNGVDGAALLATLKADDAIGALFTDAETAEDVADVISASTFTAENVDAFAQIVGQHLTTVAGTSTATESPYAINVTGDGYYLVKDKDGSVTSDEDAYTKYILRVVEDVEVAAKSDAPTLEKKIDEDGTKVDANNGSIGDKVNYVLTSKVPTMDGYNKYFFVIHDTMSEGLTFNNDVVVKIGETTLTNDKYDVITTGLTDGCTFEIVLKNFIQYKDQAGQTITITYSATINENAVIGNEGNPNEVYLEYSNNPNVDGEGTPENPDKPGPDDVTGETPDDYTITYVTAIELIKVDQDGNRLTGAEFKITGEKLNKVKVVTETFEVAEDGTYYALKDGSYTTTIPTEDTADKYVDTTTLYKKTEVITWNTETEKVSATATVGPDGILRFEGLAEGTYTITEIKAPDGYNMLTQPITVVITCAEPAAVTEGTEDAVWKYTLSGAVTQSETIAEDGIIHITVVNKAGSTLPETGGMGTTLFYVIGGIMVLAAVVLLVTKKRMTFAE